MEPEWDKYWKSRSYKRRFIEFVRLSYFSPLFTSLVSKNLKKNSLVLEAGCGSATYLKRLSEKGYRCVELDNSFQGLKIAKKNCSQLVCGDFFNLPFKKNTFDIVFNQGVMEHFNDLEFDKILTEFSRISKRVCLIIPGNLSLWRIYDPIKDDDEKRFRSRQKLRKLFKKRFEKVELKHIPRAGFLSICCYG